MNSNLDLICNKINEILKTKEEIVIAIDGISAAGKTTLANQLAKIYSANIVHSDDFFLPLKMKTIERMNTPGGNIDYIRMKKEVIDNVKNSFTYYPFSCKNQELLNPIKINNKRVLIVEGAYSMHPFFEKYYDLSIYMTIDDNKQLERIKTRNLSNYQDFIDKWIPLEKKYNEAFKIKSLADIIISNYIQ